MHTLCHWLPAGYAVGWSKARGWEWSSVCGCKKGQWKMTASIFAARHGTVARFGNCRRSLPSGVGSTHTHTSQYEAALCLVASPVTTFLPPPSASSSGAACHRERCYHQIGKYVSASIWRVFCSFSVFCYFVAIFLALSFLLFLYLPLSLPLSLPLLL